MRVRYSWKTRLATTIKSLFFNRGNPIAAGAQGSQEKLTMKMTTMGAEFAPSLTDVTSVRSSDLVEKEDNQLQVRKHF